MRGDTQKDIEYLNNNPIVKGFVVEVNEKITGEVVALNMNKSFATIAILTDCILATI